jgi:hypothetical protein
MTEEQNINMRNETLRVRDLLTQLLFEKHIQPEDFKYRLNNIIMAAYEVNMELQNILPATPDESSFT